MILKIGIAVIVMLSFIVRSYFQKRYALTNGKGYAAYAASVLIGVGLLNAVYFAFLEQRFPGWGD